MNASFPYECRQVIPDDEVATRTFRLIDCLVAAGEDPVGLVDDEFVPVVARQQIADLTHRAVGLGISCGHPHWSLTPQGDMHIVFPFACKTQAAAFKIALL
jgi:hypothetical protein